MPHLRESAARRRGSAGRPQCTETRSLTALLDKAPDELLCIGLQNGVDLVQEIVDLFGLFLCGLGGLGLGLILVSFRPRLLRSLCHVVTSRLPGFVHPTDGRPHCDLEPKSLPFTSLARGLAGG